MTGSSTSGQGWNYPAAWNLRLTVDEAADRRQQDDLEIEPQRPVADVGQVEDHPPAHVVDGAGLAASAVDLGQAGDARFDIVAAHQLGDRTGELLVVTDGMRAGADDRHVALEYI